MALKTLLTARAGLESARGTGVTPTRLIYFSEGSHSQEIGAIRPTERRASYFPAFRAYPGIERNSLEFSGDVTYDDLIWWLNLHVKAVASGTGASADKTWAFVPTAASDDLKSATIQFGYADNLGASIPAWSLPGCLGSEFSLNWAKEEPLTFSSTLMTASAASQISAFTGSLTDRAVITALGTGTQTYIDASTIGSTADNNILDGSFTLTNGLVPLLTLDSTSTATSLLRPEPRDWKLEVTRYYADKTEQDAWKAKTPRKIRVKTTGPALGGSNYSITLDAYGVWDVYDKADVDGLGVEKMTLVPLYDTGAATDFSITVVNATAALT